MDVDEAHRILAATAPYWTRDRVAKMIELHRQKHGPCAIAAKIGVRHEAASPALIRIGLFPYRDWTADHDGMARAWERQGIGIGAIARRLMREREDVADRLVELRAEYEANFGEVA